MGPNRNGVGVRLQSRWRRAGRFLWFGPVFSLALALAPPRAWGGETYAQSFHVGERAAGLAGAYTALAEEATGAYYNPAGMVDVRGGSTLGLTVSAYHLDLRSLGDQLSVGNETRGLVTRTFTSFPSSFGYVRTFGKKIRQALGLVIVVPDSEILSSQISLRVPSLADPNGGPPALNVAGSESFRHKDQTYWFGAAYAVRVHPRVSIGASIYYLLRHSQGFQSSLVQAEQGGEFFGSSEVSSVDVLHGSLRFDLGVKVRAIDRLTVGLNLRSPNIRLHSGGSFFLGEDVSLPVTPNDARLTVESNEPFQIGLGVAWEVPESWTLSFDLRILGRVGAYEGLSYQLPASASQPLPIFGALFQRDPIVNASLGGEVYLSKKFVLRGGFYTNFSTTPELQLVEDQMGADRVHLWGLALGFSYRGEKTTLGFAINYAFGFGSVVGERGALTAEPTFVLADATRQYLTMIIGGSYNL